MLYNIKLDTRKMVLVFNLTYGQATIWLWKKMYTDRNGMNIVFICLRVYNKLINRKNL